MKAWLAVTRAKAATRLQQVLAELGLEVQQIRAQEELTAGAADVALVNVDQAATRELLPPLLALEPHVYTLGLLHRPTEPGITRAYSLGVDDVMAFDACRAEIAGKLGALERIKTWLPTMPSSFLQASNRSFQTLEAWHALGWILAAEHGALLRQSLRPRRVHRPPTVRLAAGIELSAPSQGQITLGMGVDAPGAECLATALYRKPVARSTLQDVLRELVNTGGGSLKRNAREEGLALTLGLPQDLDIQAPPARARFWELHSDQGVRLYAWATARSTITRRIRASSLQEGMVLATEVRTPSGMLLVSQGSVLTTTGAQRLVRFVGANTLLEVVETA